MDDQRLRTWAIIHKKDVPEPYSRNKMMKVIEEWRREKK